MGWILLSLALANGGPDDWTHPTPVGSARPTTAVATRLVREDLQVTLQSDYDAVKAHAVYALHNPGPAETVRFAVPKLDEMFPSQGTRPLDPTPGGEAAVGGVTLSLDGAPVTCTDRALAEKLPVPFTHRKRVSPSALDDPPDEPVYDEQVATFHVGTVCEAELTIPPGDHELVLDVVEEPLHYSWSTSKDKHPGTSDRRWIWWLAPAGAWAGAVDTLSIDVDLGPHAATATVHGEGWSAEGARRTKVLTDVDLAQLEPLAVDLGVRDQDFQRVILEMSGRSYAWKALRARASSTLAGQGANTYGPANLFDRDPATAWCEGVEGPGEGEWVELRYSPIDTTHGKPATLSAEFISLQMAILPGYAKTEATWLGNGRVAEVEVAACDGSNSHAVAVPVSDDPRAALFLTNFGDDLFTSTGLPPIAKAITTEWSNSGEEACIRVRLKEVAPGSQHADTCISELAFMVDSPG